MNAPLPSTVMLAAFFCMIFCPAVSSAVVDVSSSPWLEDPNAGPMPKAPTGNNAWQEVSFGAALFTHGKVSASVTAFDKAISLDSQAKGMLWQRGLSLFYTSSWSDGASQFSYDVALNPHDTEESIWRWLCQVRTEGVAKATANMLVTTGETRPYMKVIYEMFRTGTATAKKQVLALCGHKLRGAAHKEPPPQAGQTCFYSDLYYGLFVEAHGDTKTAQTHMVRAGLSKYGVQSKDYMWWLSRVHCAVRGWPMKTDQAVVVVTG